MQVTDTEQTPFTIAQLNPRDHETLPILPETTLWFILYYKPWVVRSKFHLPLQVAEATAATKGSRFDSHSITCLQELAVSKIA